MEGRWDETPGRSRLRACRRLIAAVAVVLSIVAAGCGGSSSSSGSTATNKPANTGQPASPGESKSASNGQPSKEISSNPVRATIVHFGSKASAAEQAAATNVVQTFYTARVDKDWHTACPLLTPGGRL